MPNFVTSRPLFSLWLLPVGVYLIGCAAAIAQTPTGSLTGVVSDSTKIPLTEVIVTAKKLDDPTIVRAAVTGKDGAYQINDVAPGAYSVIAQRQGYADFTIASVQITAGQPAVANITMISNALVTSAAATPNFLKRLGKAYWDDWHPSATAASGPAPSFRGYPAPESDPPYPFTAWPMGGTVSIGQPFSFSNPIMTALYEGPSGDWWKKSKVGVFGWANAGMNFSTSNALPYGNAPAAYPQIPNSIQLDQLTLYIERQPDTVQTDHFDWGFQLTNLYGFDYRFTTAKGVLSQQLLNNPKPDGSIGNKYGYDPVMYYVDLYFPQVGQGMDVRVGRYISLPDIEAQLAPNNYTYTHSLTYTYDCYTQQGVNTTTKITDHWTVQLGISGGCESALWVRDAQVTGNICVAYYWNQGGDDIYVCANSLNDSKYSYNNLAAYYATWYHKINKNWHTDTETWYQYTLDTPNANNPAAASMIQTNSNGARCNRPDELTCDATSWAAVNYTSRQLGPHDFISIRNEFFDDHRGQRTGYKTRYEENGIGWNHWIGSSLVFRPELRYEHSFDATAYDNGTKKSQFMFAADVIFFY